MNDAGWNKQGAAGFNRYCFLCQRYHHATRQKSDAFFKVMVMGNNVATGRNDLLPQLKTLRADRARDNLTAENFAVVTFNLLVTS